MNENERIEAVVELLAPRGYAFTGECKAETYRIAAEWLEHFDDIDEIAQWIDAGFWNPDAASAVDALGVWAADVAGLANDNITGSDDPIYDICNGDLDPSALIDEN